MNHSSLRLPRLLFFSWIWVTIAALSATVQAHNSGPLSSASRQQGTPEARLPLPVDQIHYLTGNVARPNGIGWYANKLYVVCSGDGTVYELDDQTGFTNTYIYGVKDAFSIYPEKGRDGTLYLWVPDAGSRSIVRVTPAEVETIVSGTGEPWSLIPYDVNSFLVSGLRANTVEQVTRDGERTAWITGLEDPTALVLHREYLYVANTGDLDRSIEWYPLTDIRAGNPEPSPMLRGIEGITAMQIFSDGYLYFSYERDGRGLIGRIQPDICRDAGGCRADQVELVLDPRLNAPLAGLMITPDGRMFFHTRYGSVINWVQLDSQP